MVGAEGYRRDNIVSLVNVRVLSRASALGNVCSTIRLSVQKLSETVLTRFDATR